jgi:ribosomal-protein-alanine N-acetyltransferase
MKAPELIETARLHLRRPLAHDAEAIYYTYASNPLVTRYLSWPTHRSVDDTRAFISWSDSEWQRWPAGPYLAFDRSSEGRLLGSTGLAFKSQVCAATGYVFAERAWSKGFATESLTAMVQLAQSLGVQRLEAICHVEHRASAHVMEKCGLNYEGVLRAHTRFPNLSPGTLSDVFAYGISF